MMDGGIDIGRHADPVPNGSEVVAPAAVGLTSAGSAPGAMPAASEHDHAVLAPAPEMRVRPRRPQRGHHAKIAAAVAALRAEGQLPPHLRPVERNQRVLMKLKAVGYGTDLPSRPALGRFFAAVDA